MAKFKKFGLFALSLASIIALGACTNGGNTTTPTTTQPNEPIKETYPDVDIMDVEEGQDLRFSSIGIDTTNAKTVFYVGEEFTHSGIKVSINYILYVDGERKGLETVETENYSIDYSEVDTNTVGTYPVTIGYRDGAIVRKATYNVTVKSALFETTPNIEYYSGLDVAYIASQQANGNVKEILLDSDYTFQNAYCEYTLYKNAVDANGVITTTTETLRARNVTVEHNIDTSKVGTYVVKLSYDGGEVDINGVGHKNVVTAFVLVDVINPVVSIEKISTNDVNFSASTNLLDLSAWKFKINRTVASGNEEVNYTEDLFTIDGVCGFIPGEQVASVRFNELTASGTYPIVEVPITIAESANENININTQLDYGMVMTGTDAETGLPSGYTTKVDTELTQIDANGQVWGANITREFKGRSADGLQFLIRTKVESPTKGGEIVFKMDKPGTIVVYVSSTGSGEPVRDFSFYGPDGVAIYDFQTVYYDIATRYEIKVDAAGEYKLYGTSTIYLHGCIIATEK